MKKFIKYNNVEYFMPFLFCNDIYIPVLNELLKNEVNPIKYVYGSVYSSWSGGGRQCHFKLKNLYQIDDYLERLKKYNVIPTFTFTNLDVKSKLNDEYSNNLLDIAYSKKAHFIVATKELYEHIKLRYPDAKMHCSVIIPSIKRIDDKNFNETKFYNEMLDKYEVVVIRPEYTMENIEKLDKLLNDISRVEVLINQYCMYNCPVHKEHYLFISKLNDCEFNRIPVPEKEQRLIAETMSEETFSLCPKNKKDKIDFRNVLISSDMVEKLINLGVRKLKLQGRSYSYDALFEQLYNNFFNNEISVEEIKLHTNQICAQIVQNNKKAALIYI